MLCLRCQLHGTAVGDCSTGATKKACANCSCGRAEEEAQGIKASLTADMLENPQSACGSVRVPSVNVHYLMCLVCVSASRLSACHPASSSCSVWLLRH